MAYTNPAGFRDRFNPLNNYKSLLFIEGNGLQASELNELQDTIRKDLELISNFLVTNGTLLTGGTVVSLSSSLITLAAAGVLINGHVVQVPGLAVTITGVGTEIIGIAYIENLVSSSTDPTLVELDEASPIVGQPTSYRQQATGRWTLSSNLLTGEIFFPIITLFNGQIVTVSPSTNTDNFSNLLNQYDREIRQSAVLYGMTPSFSSIDGNGFNIVGISSGKARVNGIPVIIPYQQNVALDPANDLKTALGEPYTYTGNATYNTRYNLISSVTSVQGTKQITVSVNKGVAGSTDSLPNTPVLAVQSVTQGGTTYTSPTNYTLVGDNIVWGNAVSQPANGSAYTVQFTYISTFVPAISGDFKGIVLDSSNPLVSGSNFFVNYIYFLKRIDRVSIDSSGNYIITKGTPGYSNYYASPKVAGILSLALVNIVKGATPIVTQDTTLNVFVSDLNSIITQVQTLQSNVASLSLIQNANNQSPTSTKRNIFTDNLYDSSQQDAGNTNTCILYYDSTNTVGTSGNSLQIASTMALLGRTSSLVTLPRTSIDSNVKQTSVTTIRTINPYTAATTALMPKTTIVPPIKYTNEINYWNNSTSLPAATTVVVSGTNFSNNGVVNVNIGTPTTTTSYNPSNNAIVTNSNSIATGTFTANSTGSGSVTITIPSGTAAGLYLVTVQDASTGSYVQTTFSVIGNPGRLKGDYNINNYYKWVGPNLVKYLYDPMAQIFLNVQNFDVTGASIYFDTAPGAGTYIRIVDVVNAIPDQTTVYAQAYMPPGSITAGSFNNITFDSPALLAYGNYYALIITDVTRTGKVGTAKNILPDIFTSVPFAKTTLNGASPLLLSTDYPVWSPALNGEQLSFKLKQAVYTTTPTTVTLVTTSSLTSISEWFVSGPLYIPSGTSCRLYLQDASGNQYDIVDNTPLFTTPISGIVTLNATISSTSTSKSPIIPIGLELIAGTPTLPSTYTSRQVSIVNGVTTPANLTIVMDVYQPTSSSIIVQVQKADTTWDAATIGVGVATGNGWSTTTWTYTGLAANATRLRIILNTTDRSARPKVQNLRMIIV